MNNSELDAHHHVWCAEKVDTLVYQWRQENRAFVIATVIDTGGSTPRLCGARLASDGARFGGTIGGGAIEKRVLDASRTLLSSFENTALIEVHLVRDLGMCCGGKMSVFLNKVDAQPTLLIFGAGHIGTALARLSADSTFRVHLIDDRAEWIDQSRHPNNVTLVDEDPEWHIDQLDSVANAYVCIATHAHDLDQRLVEKLLKNQNPPRYLGLIGSKGKWLRFKGRLSMKSIPENRLEQVVCPAGLDIGAETPDEIAVSVFAQMIQSFRTLESIDSTS